MNIKICFKCKQTKKITEFNKDKSKKDGLATYCKKCSNYYIKKEPKYFNATEIKCWCCNKIKPIDNFYTIKSGKRKGKFITCCKECNKIKSKKYCNAHAKRQNELATIWAKKHSRRVKITKIKRRYGLSEEEYNKLPKICAICGSPSFLVFDHCHQTNKFRELLCSSCNKGLGFFKDNSTLLNKAYNYLIKWGR